MFVSCLLPPIFPWLSFCMRLHTRRESKSNIMCVLFFLLKLKWKKVWAQHPDLQTEIWGWRPQMVSKIHAMIDWRPRLTFPLSPVALDVNRLKYTSLNIQEDKKKQLNVCQHLPCFPLRWWRLSWCRRVELRAIHVRPNQICNRIVKREEQRTKRRSHDCKQVKHQTRRATSKNKATEMQSSMHV